MPSKKASNNNRVYFISNNADEDLTKIKEAIITDNISFIEKVYKSSINNSNNSTTFINLNLNIELASGALNSRIDLLYSSGTFSGIGEEAISQISGILTDKLNSSIDLLSGSLTNSINSGISGIINNYPDINQIYNNLLEIQNNSIIYAIALS